MPDYQVGNAPYGASYTPPKVDFSAIGEAPDTYFKGTQQRRTLALQNAFPNGIPIDERGQPDFRSMANTLIKLGGADAAQQTMQMWLGQEAAGQVGRAISGTEGQGDSGGQARADPGPNTGPAHLKMPQPALSSRGTDNAGADTVRSLATELAGGQDANNLIRTAAMQFRVGPDQELSPEQAQVIRGRLSQLRTGGGGPTSATDLPGPSPAGMTAGPGAPSQQGGQPAAPPAPAAPQMAQAPQAAPQQAQPGPVAPAQPGQGGDVLAVPPQFAPAVRQRYVSAVALLNSAAANPNLPASAREAAKDQANALKDRIKTIDEFWSKRGEVPPGTKEALGEGYRGPVEAAAAKKGQEEEGTQGRKQYEALAAGGRAYEVDLKPLFGAAKSFLQDPNMWSGTGGDFSLFVNKLKNLAGTNPNAALAQEGLSKITSMTTLANLNQQKYDMAEMGQGSAGRIFAQQVDLVTKTAPGLENTIPGNLLLVEINDRLGSLRAKMAQMARDDIAAQRAAGNKNPHLVPDQFDAKVAKYLEQNPIFSKKELDNPRLIAPPTFKSPQDVKSAGLPSGSPFKTPDGRIKYVP